MGIWTLVCWNFLANSEYSLSWKCNIALSVTALIFLGFLLSSIFVLPIMLFIYIKRISNFINALILSSILILLESARFFILGGFPWLQPGVIFLDTILDFLIPIIGVIGCSLLFYLIVSAAALSSKKEYKYGLSILLIIAFAIPSVTTKLDIHNSSDEHLKFGIVQPSLDHVKNLKVIMGNQLKID